MKRQGGEGSVVRQAGRQHLEPSAHQYQGLSSDQLSSGRRRTLPRSPPLRERPLRGQEIKEGQVGEDKRQKEKEGQRKNQTNMLWRNVPHERVRNACDKSVRRYSMMRPPERDSSRRSFFVL